MTTERRRYFRINDRALVRYRVVADGALESERRALRARELDGANLATALLEIDVHLQAALAALDGRDRALAEALDLLNRKVTLVGRLATLAGSPPDGAPDHREHQPRDLSLSAGGIALAADTPLALNADLVVDLVLLPSNHALRALGRVADCRGRRGGGFDIAIEFSELREADREALAQHVTRRQSETRRAQRSA